VLHLQSFCIGVFLQNMKQAVESREADTDSNASPGQLSTPTPTVAQALLADKQLGGA